MLEFSASYIRDLTVFPDIFLCCFPGNEAVMRVPVPVWKTLKDLGMLGQPIPKHEDKACTCAWWRHPIDTLLALLVLCAGNSPHKNQWRGALIFSLICPWINGWVNNGEAGDLRRHHAHYAATVIKMILTIGDWVISFEITLSYIWLKLTDD